MNSTVFCKYFSTKGFGVLLSALIFITTNSCKTLYFPNTHNVPMMSQKGEFQVNANLDISTFLWDISAAIYDEGKISISPGLQTAYAVTDNLAVMANGQLKSCYFHDFWNDLEDEKIGFLGYPYYYGEGAFGYYINKPHKNKRMFTYEVYGGAGMGRVHYHWLTDGDSKLEGHTSNVTKFFIQPSFSTTKFDSRASFGVVNRISYVEIIDHGEFILEPGFILRVGSDWLSFNFNFGFAVMLLGDEIMWLNNNYIGSVGMHMKFGHKKHTREIPTSNN